MLPLHRTIYCISWQKKSRLTCLLYCIRPRVGKTQVAAAGRSSWSAKCTYCWTRAASSGLEPLSWSLATTNSKKKSTTFEFTSSVQWWHKASDIGHSPINFSKCPIHFGWAGQNVRFTFVRKGHCISSCRYRNEPSQECVKFNYVTSVNKCCARIILTAIIQHKGPLIVSESCF